MIFFYLKPTSDTICSLRWWLFGFGLVLLTAGVFARSYQLKKIHALVKSGQFQATKRIDHLKLVGMIMGVVIAVELIFLLIGQYTDPFKSSIVALDPITLTGEWHCVSSNATIWIGVQSGYLIFLLVLGIYAMYSTWGISSSVDDVRVNIFVIFLCVSLIIVADFTSPTVAVDSGWSWWGIGVMILWSLSMMCSIYIPKVIKVYSGSSSSQSSSKESKSTAQ